MPPWVISNAGSLRPKCLQRIHSNPCHLHFDFKDHRFLEQGATWEKLTLFFSVLILPQSQTSYEQKLKREAIDLDPSKCERCQSRMSTGSRQAMQMSKRDRYRSGRVPGGCQGEQAVCCLQMVMLSRR